MPRESEKKKDLGEIVVNICYLTLSPIIMEWKWKITLNERGNECSMIMGGRVGFWAKLPTAVGFQLASTAPISGAPSLWSGRWRRWGLQPQWFFWGGKMEPENYTPSIQYLAMENGPLEDVFPIQKWAYSSQLCDRLPEGNNINSSTPGRYG